MDVNRIELYDKLRYMKRKVDLTLIAVTLIGGVTIALLITLLRR